MSDVSKFFLNKCKEMFRFLVEEYGCEIIGTDKSIYHTAVTYKNSTTGIRVSFEPRERAIFVYLIRLTDGKIREYLDAPNDWHYLDGVVSLRSPSLRLFEKKTGPDWLTTEEVEDLLLRSAKALKQFADDVLRGDFSVFAELEKRLPRRPQS